VLAEEALLLAVAVEQPRLEERPGNNFSVPFQGWCFAEDFALWLLQAGNKALLQEVLPRAWSACSPSQSIAV